MCALCTVAATTRNSRPQSSVRSTYCLACLTTVVDCIRYHTPWADFRNLDHSAVFIQQYHCCRERTYHANLATCRTLVLQNTCLLPVLQGYTRQHVPPFSCGFAPPRRGVPNLRGSDTSLAAAAPSPHLHTATYQRYLNQGLFAVMPYTVVAKPPDTSFEHKHVKSTSTSITNKRG